MEGTGISDIASLEGRVVSTRIPRQRRRSQCRAPPACERTRSRSRRHPSWAWCQESVGALKDGKIHAFFWSGGLPTRGAPGSVAHPGRHHAPRPDGWRRCIAARDHTVTLYLPSAVPPGVYPGVESPVPRLGVMNLLVVNASMAEQLAYDITRVLLEQSAGAGGHSSRGAQLEARIGGQETRRRHSIPAPLRYYREKGAVK